MQVFAAALDHGGGVVHGNHLAVVLTDMPAQRLGHRTQRAAEVVQAGIRLSELCGDHADILNDRRVTRYRTLDHVGEHPCHVLVEDEVLDTG